MLDGISKGKLQESFKIRVIKVLFTTVQFFLFIGHKGSNQFTFDHTKILTKYASRSDQF